MRRKGFLAALALVVLVLVILLSPHVYFHTVDKIVDGKKITEPFTLSGSSSDTSIEQKMHLLCKDNSRQIVIGEADSQAKKDELFSTLDAQFHGGLSDAFSFLDFAFSSPRVSESYMLVSVTDSKTNLGFSVWRISLQWENTSLNVVLDTEDNTIYEVSVKSVDIDNSKVEMDSIAKKMVSYWNLQNYSIIDESTNRTIVGLSTKDSIIEFSKDDILIAIHVIAANK